MNGFKTYIVSGVMVLLGLYFMFTEPTGMTWDSPDATLADLRVAMRQIVGWVLLAQGLANASIRHAISRAGR